MPYTHIEITSQLFAVSAVKLMKNKVFNQCFDFSPLNLDTGFCLFKWWYLTKQSIREGIHSLELWKGHLKEVEGMFAQS